MNKPICNICDASDWREFGGRGKIQCARCGSLERTRLLYLHLQKVQLPKHGSKILHFAPELGLLNKFIDNHAIEYIPVDFTPENYGSVSLKRFDMCKDASNLEENEFDLIIHNHVLEHIRCNVSAVLYYLHRTLTVNGFHFFSIPLQHGRCYEEYLGDLSHEDAVRRFGQHDHCRIFSVEDLQETLGMLFKINLKKFIPIYNFSEKELQAINFPEYSWERLDGNTIFKLRKDDIIYSIS